MNFFCPQCGAMVAVADVDLGKDVAKCRHCQNLFSCAQVVRREQGTQRAAPGARSSAPAALLPRPAKMQVQEFAGTLTISWRWFSPIILFLIFFCVVWDGFLVAWYGIAAFGSSRHGMGTVALLFPILHVMVGIGLTYFTVCGLVNHTRVTLDNAALTIKHGPLPWPGRQFARHDLRQLFCKEVVSQGKNQTSVSYNLMAILADGSERRVLSTMSDASEARFLEQQLERRLGIVDQPVIGEHR